MDRNGLRKIPQLLNQPSLRQLAVIGVDGLITALSLWAAMLLRFEGHITEFYLLILGPLATLLVGCRLLCNVFFRLHRWSFRFSSLTDGARVGLSGLAGSGLFLALLFLFQVPGTPRSVVALELLLSTSLMATIRFSPRLAGMYAADLARAYKKDTQRTLIVGAGSAGELLLRDLHRSGEHNYNVVGFVDDDRSKWGMIVGGKKVLGGITDLPRLARDKTASQVLIAIPRLAGRRIREILTVCADIKLSFKILPVSFLYLQERSATSMMQDLSPEDLLMREAVSFGESDAPVTLSDRTALVTGAAGSIGSEICRQLLRTGLQTLVMVDLNENGLYLEARRFGRDYPKARVEVEVADIRDPARILALFGHYRPQEVFHAAAHKHVPLMETAPCEAVKNNILGTKIVAEAAHACGAERMVYISTDKAVRPTSVMGASKRAGEIVVRSMARYSPTRFCAVRFGNVLGSSGSVVPIFREQIAAGGPVTVTHPEVRRYFMTIGEAVALVLQAAYHDYGELCVLDMGEQIRITDLARHMITMTGLVPDTDIPVVFTGLRPGEKLFEELLTEEEERTRKVNQKILVAESPPPPEDIDERIRDLREAAAAEDGDLVVSLLRRLVPSYSPIAAAPASEEQVKAARPGQTVRKPFALPTSVRPRRIARDN